VRALLPQNLLLAACRLDVPARVTYKPWSLIVLLRGESMRTNAGRQSAAKVAEPTSKGWILVAPGQSLPPGGSDTQDVRLTDESGKPLRILVVEDDPAVAALLQDMVEEAGGEPVGLITSALAAIGAAAVIAPDVVLMDVRLHGAMDGVEATEVIRARRSAAVVIITGAGADPEIRTRLAALDGVEIVYKPVIERELCGAILRARKPRAGF
jgi:CheY-like chemotaxis protein